MNSSRIDRRWMHITSSAASHSQSMCERVCPCVCVYVGRDRIPTICATHKSISMQMWMFWNRNFDDKKRFSIFPFIFERKTSFALWLLSADEQTAQNEIESVESCDEFNSRSLRLLQIEAAAERALHGKIRPFFCVFVLATAWFGVFGENSNWKFAKSNHNCVRARAIQLEILDLLWHWRNQFGRKFNQKLLFWFFFLFSIFVSVLLLNWFNLSFRRFYK